jgi:hypothetical protein
MSLEILIKLLYYFYIIIIKSIMNASYKRYWEPNYLQATSLSLIAGAIATAATYPLDFLKTVVQYRG